MAPVPAAPAVPDLGPAAVIDIVLQAAAGQVLAVVKPAAAAAVAVGFTFPLALMLLVLLFMVAQSRIDRRDPRLRGTRRGGDKIVLFESEETL